LNKPKKMKPWHDIFNNLRLRERMLLVFFMSSVVPMIIMMVYLFGTVRNMILNQVMDSETRQLEIMADSISHRMMVAADLASSLEEDPTIIEIAKKMYSTEEEFSADIDRCYVLRDYLRYYQRELESIEIYTWNDTIPENDVITVVTSEIWSEKWYINIMNSNVEQYWDYQINEDSAGISLAVCRLIRDENGKAVAIVRMILPADATGMEIMEHEEDTLLYYDDIMPLQSNFTGDFDAINILLQHEKGDMGSSIVNYNDARYIMSYLKIKPENAEHYYTVLSLKPYSDIQETISGSAAKLLLPMLIFIGLGFALIIIYVTSASNRLNKFKNCMHRAANGNLEPIPPIGGKDEIAELADDLQAMIDGIQKLMTSLVRENVQKEKLHTRQREVEFKMLANQINPHFLYNTLETIRMTARVNGQPDIEELTKMLAKILRRNIQAGETLQTVESEMQLIEYYLKIQDYRFHDRISYHVEIEDAERIGKMKIMPLLIQPFVENSFGHGLEGMDADGRISITARADEYLWIVVSDNGHGMSSEQLEEIRESLKNLDELDRTHIGICNVHQRIRYRYGDEYGVSIESGEGKGTTVTIKIPINAERYIEN